MSSPGPKKPVVWQLDTTVIEKKMREAIYKCKLQTFRNGFENDCSQGLLFGMYCVSNDYNETVYQPGVPE